VAAAPKCRRRVGHRKALLSEAGATQDATVLGKAGQAEHSSHELRSPSGPNAAAADSGQLRAAAIMTNYPKHLGAAASLHRRQLKDEEVGISTVYDYFDCIERC